MPAAFNFDEAREAMERASTDQKTIEEQVRAVYRDAAQKDEKFRIALAKKMLELHDAGVGSWSACETIARGETEIAALRREKEIAEGVREAVSQAAFRVSADRRDLSRLIDWSSRVALASGEVW